MRPKNKYVEITINNYSIRVEEERERIARELHDKTMYEGPTRQDQNVLKKILERKSRVHIAEELNIVPRIE